MEDHHQVLAAADIKNEDTFPTAKEESSTHGEGIGNTELQLKCPKCENISCPGCDGDFHFETVLLNAQMDPLIIKEEPKLIIKSEIDDDSNKLSLEGDASQKRNVKNEHLDRNIRPECSQRVKQKAHGKNRDTKKSHTCDICKQSFVANNLFESHMRTHTIEKPYACDICKKRFARIGHLKMHMRTHTGEKPYSCDVCKKGFSENGSLKMHMRTHTGDKLYSCDTCKKSFSQSGYLKTHMRIHTGEKPYSCDTCDRSFSQRGYLKTHMRIHTGEKPYSCDTCQRSFNTSVNLKRHMKVHNGES